MLTKKSKKDSQDYCGRGSSTILDQTKCIHQLFELQVSQSPDEIAVSFGRKSLTYSELNKKSNQLARHLVQQGLTKDSYVVICVERSIEMIIGILGILKAGAAYVPIDPEYPISRKQFVLEDTKASFLLTQECLLQSLPKSSSKSICIDTFFEGKPQFDSSNLHLESSIRDLIYLIYTSGSTGKPKGVQVEHRNVSNLIQGQIDFVNQPVSRFLYTYSFAFDGSVLLIWWTLLQGATLVIAQKGAEKDVQKIANCIQKNKITHLLTFPSLYSILLEQNNSKKLASLESVSLAGEIFPAKLAKQHIQKLAHTTLLNQYGPTEATVGATIFQVPQYFQGDKVPIGKAINGVCVYVLDENLNKAKINEQGEIYIGGKGVARGYLNRPELTKEKFISNPFSDDPNERLYKTGDLAKVLPSGHIDFMGRADYQIKLRGYRIELAEVESVLLENTKVRDAVVKIQGDTAANKKLVAYFTLKKNAQLTTTQIREFLGKKLPEYMIPALYKRLNKMPIATSGKIDRKNLPDVANVRPAINQEFKASETHIQDWLTHLWQEELGIQEVGIEDKFFELGGNSLQAGSLIGKVQNTIKETVFVVSLFESPTIKEYAQFLEKNYAQSLHNIPTIKEKKTAIQEDHSIKKPHYLDNLLTKQTIIPKKLEVEDFSNFQDLVPHYLKEKNGEIIKKNAPAIFILSPPRSGSTLLRVMLAGSPDLFAANELQLLHFDELKKWREVYTGKFSLWSEGTIRAIMQLKNCDVDTARGIVQEYENLGTSTKEFYSILQEWAGDRIIVDKSPSYATDIKVLEKAEREFENAIFIHLARHPYSMVQSFTKMHMDQVMFLHSHEYDAKQLGELIWQKSHQNIKTFLQGIPQDRQANILFEDLVKEPEMVIKNLCKKLNLSFHPNMIRPYSGAKNKMIDGLHEHSKAMGDPNFVKYGKIRSDKADEWKNAANNNFLHSNTWDLAGELGYNEDRFKPKNSVTNLIETERENLESKSTNTRANHNSTKDNNQLETNSSKDQKQNRSLEKSNSDVAIIGMSGRFPGADNIQELWQNIIEAKDVSHEFSEEELQKSGVEEKLLKNPNYVRRGMPLKDADKFDASFFGYLPKEAALIDPQHRIFLECAYSAIEDAGYSSDNYKGRIGVYASIAKNTYLHNNVLSHPNYYKSIENFTQGITQEKDFTATRVAYKLNLKGAALSVQTACSGSGVAIHLACQSLLTGDNDLIVVGGGRVQPPLATGHLHTEGHALSPDGYCRPFDVSADGMVRGNGMALVVLKKLDQAIADGDTIHAVIKATAIGNDGSEKIGFTAPSIKGQSQTITKAYQKSGINPETISYIEAHGTGTHIGDPIEIAGLTKAFSEFTDKKGFCAIGSIKSNIGHLDAGACVAGLIKTVLSMKNGQLPKILNYRSANPQINFEDTPFFVNDSLREWKKGDDPLRAGISSFGLGGTNVHIVLEEAPESKKAIESSSSQLLLLSGKTEDALRRNTKNLGKSLASEEFSTTNSALQDIAYTLQTGRNHHKHRSFLVAENKEQAAELLTNFDNSKLRTSTVGKGKKKIAYMFPGGGTQYTNMGLGLYYSEPVYRETLDDCLNLLKEQHDLDLRKILFPDFCEMSEDFGQLNTWIKASSDPIENPLHGIALLFIVEYATAKLWSSYGLKPEELIGHSLGEYVAACIAEVFTLEEALSMVVKRGRLFDTLPSGAMLSIQESAEDISPLLNDKLSIAAINKPNNCVISGGIEAIKELKEVLNKKEIHSTFLHISVAAHSTELEPILEEFGEFLEGINYKLPSLPIISNLTGKAANPEHIASPEYWLSHLRQTVRFAEGIETLLNKENRILLEVGPGQSLSTLTRQHPSKKRETSVLASIRHPQESIPDSAFFQKTLGLLWLEGITIDWNKGNAKKERMKVSLPTYSFEREKHWIEAKRQSSTETVSNANFNLIKAVPMTTEISTVPNEIQKEYSRTESVMNDLKRIFKDLSGLQLEQKDEQFTFLELGFDSLFLTQAVGKIKKEFKVELSFRRLFEDASCLADLSNLVAELLPDSYDEQRKASFQKEYTNNTQVLANRNNSPRQIVSVPQVQLTKRDCVLKDLKQIFQDMSGLILEKADEQFTFLELGFDSLFLTQAVGKIKQEFKVVLSFRTLIESASTIHDLTDLITEQVSEEKYKSQLSNQQQLIQAPMSQEVQEQIVAASSTNTIQNTNSTAEYIIQQQLLLMEKQLNLLQNNGSANSQLFNKQADLKPLDLNKTNHTNAKPNTAQSTNYFSPEKNNKGSQQVSEGTKHNHWKPISKKPNSARKGKFVISERQQKYLDQLISRYTEKTKGSQSLTQAQRVHLADPRAVSGFNKLWKDMIYQIAAVRSKGSKIWDVDGNEYIDYRNSFGIALFGHTPDFIQKAISEQLEKGIELGVLTPLAQKTADLLCELSGTERATFVNTGSESLSAAVRAARTVTMKDKIAYFTGNYHGIADEMLARGVHRNGQDISMPVAPGIPQFLVENVLVLNYDDPNVLDKIRANADELAAVLIEPIQPNNPSHQPKALFQAIRELTIKEDIALIFDEMITGFRLGIRGAQAWYNIEADIVCYGKIISGGLPMAAVAGKAKYLDVFDGGPWQYGDESVPEVGVTFFGGTFVRHPLSLAASYAALSEIKSRGQKIYDELNEKSAKFAERISKLFIASKVPMKVLSTASIIAFKPTTDNPFSKLFFFYLQLNGIHIAEKAALLSVAHTQADLDFTYRMIEETIKEMQTADFFSISLKEISDENEIVYPPILAEIATDLGQGKKKVPLTEGQKEIWIEQQINKEAAAAYNLSSEFIFTGALEEKALKTAVQRLIQRHEALRTFFNKKETSQIILNEVKVDLPLHDLSSLSSAEQQVKLEELKFKEVELPLDLFTGPLIRFQLIRVNELKHYLLMTVHHAIADGWSCGILANDLAKLYTAECQSLKAQLSIPNQLSSYALEQENYRRSQEYKLTEKYWLSQFEGDIPVLDLPTDYTRPRIKTYNCALEKLRIDEKLYAGLKKTAASNGTTFFFLMYSAFHTFLHRLSGQDDLVLGLVTAGQTISNNPNLVAHGVNLLPVRITVNDELPFSQHLKTVRAKILDAFEHQNYTLGSLVKKLNLTHDSSRLPLISVLFNMDAESNELNFNDLETSLNPIPRNYETFDIFINVKPVGNNCIFELIYNTDLFSSETIKNRLSEFEVLLNSIVENPDTPVGKLSILPEYEKQKLLGEWNNTISDFPDQICLHKLIEQQSSKTPQNIAIKYRNEEISYAELNKSANQLANYLLKNNVQKGDFVGIYIERSIDLIIGLLAIMKTGGIYVPLDPSNPKDRLKTIIEDAQAKLIISNSAMIDYLPKTGATIILKDKIKSDLKGISEENPDCNILPSDSVYVIYTSGSTGKPKGVIIPHYSIINHHTAILDRIKFEQKDVFFSVATVSFDPSVQDFFLPLMIGAKIIIAPQEIVADAFALKSHLENSGASSLQATPATWKMLLTAGWQGSPDFTILTGGEGLTRDLADKLLEKGKTVWNIYGPTETTIWSTAKKIEKEAHFGTDYESVGKPLNNVQVFLLDKYMQAVPIGFAGEVYIGGVGVSPNGYFKRDQLSQEKFVPTPNTLLHSYAQNHSLTHQNIYRTGDIARYLPNGDLEYLRRADGQVKIRGFRIELGEVESTVSQLEEIEQAVVVVRENQNNNKVLVAYVLFKEGKSIDTITFKGKLKSLLPEYMIPAILMEISEFPLTATLKIDRNRLPKPDFSYQDIVTKYVAPNTAMESKIAKIWSEVLDIPKIGIHDSFFDLGGHSLIAVNLMAKIEQETGKKLPLSALLENTTISRLAQLIQDEKKSEQVWNSLIPVKSTGNKPPIYIVHGAGLHVMLFRVLGEHIGEDRPVYALQALGLNGEAEPLESIEEIAAHYVSQIIEHNPNGPYALGGYSFGGIIAFEMAKQLRAAGKKLAFLGMFDTIVHPLLTIEGRSKNKIQNWGYSIKKYSWETFNFLRSPLANYRYRAFSLKRRFQRFKYKLSSAKEENNEFANKVDRANYNAFFKYRITPYEGKIHLFRAKEKRFYLSDFESLGWKPYAQEIIIQDVAGDHINLFDGENGETFALTLSEYLKAAFGEED